MNNRFPTIILLLYVCIVFGIIGYFYATHFHSEDADPTVIMVQINKN